LGFPCGCGNTGKGGGQDGKGWRKMSFTGMNDYVFKLFIQQNYIKK
jgi:hypothetical protein